MDINTLTNGIRLGFFMSTGLAVLCMSCAGLLTALYMTVPPIRDWLEYHLFSREEQTHHDAMIELDRTYRHQVKQLRRATNPVIYLQQ